MAVCFQIYVIHVLGVIVGSFPLSNNPCIQSKTAAFEFCIQQGKMKWRAWTRKNKKEQGGAHQFAPMPYAIAIIFTVRSVLKAIKYEICLKESSRK